MILIVGGMGFIGLNTARRFLEVGEQVVITQHAAHRVPDFLNDAVGIHVFTARLDVTNPYEVFDVVRRHQVDSIINLMAPPARSLSTQADYHLYTTSLQNVLQAAYTFGLKRVSLGSSVSVYGGLPTGPYHEDMPLPVTSATQVSAFKKAMEIHALYYADRLGIEVVSLRIASIYGPLYYSTTPSAACAMPLSRIRSLISMTVPMGIFSQATKPTGRMATMRHAASRWCTRPRCCAIASTILALAGRLPMKRSSPPGRRSGVHQSRCRLRARVYDRHRYCRLYRLVTAPPAVAVGLCNASLYGMIGA